MISSSPENTIMVPDEANLSTLVLETVAIENVANILGTSSSGSTLIGADGGHLESFTDTTSNITYNAVDADGDGQLDTVSFTTDFGAHVTVNFETGEYVYSVERSDNDHVNFTDIFSVTIKDNDGDSSISNLTINVNFDADTTYIDSNTAPIAVDDSINVLEGEVYTSTIDLDDNDNDLDGDNLTVTAETIITNEGGTIIISSDGSYTYTPLIGFNGLDTVNYTVSDGTLSDIGILSINVVSAPSLNIIDGNGTIDGEQTVKESALVDSNDNSNIISSTFNISTDGGLESIKIATTVILLSTLEASATTPIIVDTTDGEIIINNFDSTTGIVSYTYTLDTANSNSIDSIDISVTDTNGFSVSDTLDIKIEDSIPLAQNQTFIVPNQVDYALDGNLNLDISADAMDFAWNETLIDSSFPTLYSNGQEVVLNYNNDTLTGTINGGTTTVVEFSVDMTTTMPTFSYELSSDLLGVESISSSSANVGGGNTTDGYVIEFKDINDIVLSSILLTATDASGEASVNTSGSIGISQGQDISTTDTLNLDFGTDQATSINFLLNSNDGMSWIATGINLNGETVTTLPIIVDENIDTLNISSESLGMLYIENITMTATDGSFKLEIGDLTTINYESDINLDLAYDVTDFDENGESYTTSASIAIELDSDGSIGDISGASITTDSAGLDTLIFADNDMSIDFAALSGTIPNIDTIELAGANQDLTLSISDVMNVTDDNSLRIDGLPGDTIHIDTTLDGSGEWTLSDTESNADYNVYTGLDDLVTLEISTSIVVDES